MIVGDNDKRSIGETGFSAMTFQKGDGTQETKPAVPFVVVGVATIEEWREFRRSLGSSEREIAVAERVVAASPYLYRLSVD